MITGVRSVRGNDPRRCRRLTDVELAEPRAWLWYRESSPLSTPCTIGCFEIVSYMTHSDSGRWKSKMTVSHHLRRNAPCTMHGWS